MQTVLLISGLPLNKISSFYRQLTLLAAFLNDRGLKSIIAGPFSEQNASTGLFEDDLQNLEGLICETQADSVILLGYAGQFPFLHKNEKPTVPVFLMAQHSSPPKLKHPVHFLPVPLTEKTYHFLVSAGLSGIGPIIPHGVDTSVYHPAKINRRLKDRFVVGTVGANTLRKRFDRIIESFAQFCRYREDGFLLIKTNRLVSIDGIDLQALAEKAGIQSRIKIITDDLTEYQMCRLYNEMDIYINLSEWEGFCIPIIEAMACGIPVVTHPVQGPGEIVPYNELTICGSTAERDGDTILLQADTKETARSLLKAAENPALLEFCSRTGRKEVEKRYDIRIVARVWKKLINGYNEYI